MTQQRRGTRDVVWIGLLMGLFALLCINVAVGITKGYAKPPGGPLLVLLAAPGLALGWGGVALLFVAIPYALLTWRHGKGPGSVLAVLGSLVFAFGVGGIAGVMTSPAAAGGGRLAGGLASLLRDGVGIGLASLVLGLVAVPGILLALAPLVLETAGARAMTRAQGGRGAKAWYPDRKVLPDGSEAPPEFTGATDIGAIRYREPGEPAKPSPTPPTATVSLSPPSAAGPAAKKAKPIAGVRYADEPLPDVGAPSPAAASDAKDDDLPSGVRYATSSMTLPPAVVPVEVFPVEVLPVEAARAEEVAAPAAPEPAPVVAPAEDDTLDAQDDDVGPPQARPEGREAPAAPAPAAAIVGAEVVPPPTPVARPAPATARAGVPPTPSAPAPVAFPLPSTAPLPPPTPWAELRPPEAPAPPAPKLAVPPPVMPPPAVPPLAAAPAAAVPVISAETAVSDATRSSAAYRRKLDATGIVDGGSAARVMEPEAPSPPPTTPSAPAPRPAVPAKPRPAKPSRPKDLHEAIRGLFSSLPMEELPPVQPAIDPPEEPAKPEPRIDPPGQRTLFDDATVPRAPGARHPGTGDALFGPSVEAALERGSASLVLLKRKLGVGYARAASLMEALVEEGILGEMTASGSRPTLITLAEWRQRAGR